MEATFWHQRWADNEIGFHASEVNPHLLAHWSTLALPAQSRVLVPLCGKTLDIGWLLSQGYRVVGAELSQLAVEQLFKQLGLDPSITVEGELSHYQSGALDIWCGDIFALSGASLGPVDAIYDRAALVALPAPMRSRYCQHLLDISSAAPQLLLCFEYDQSKMPGPPFSVNEDEVRRHYGGAYRVELLSRSAVAGRLKDQVQASETVWRLQPES